MQRLKQASLRQKLLIPIMLIMAASVTALFIVIVSVQSSQLKQLSETVKNGLEQTNRSADESYTRLEQDVAGYLTQLSDTLNASITKTTQDSLEKEKAALTSDFTSVLQQKGESLASLLARVAPPAILANNYLDLIGFAKSATHSEGIVYAIFLRPNGKPMTRFLDRSSKLIQRYLDSGKEKNKALRVIAASKKDDSVLLVETPIWFEGKPLGKIVICVDKAEARDKITAMSDRFNQLIEANAQQGRAIITAESTKLNQQIEKQLKQVSNQSTTALNEVVQTLHSASETVRSKTQTASFLTGIACGVVVFTFLFIFLSRVSRSIGKITTVLNKRSESIVSASVQVASTSRQLAEGASEQAAAIEETSASLEEMDSMTRQNADNAGQANHVMQETTVMVADANQSMDELTGSMSEISQASAETSKIIKTIDEIAFQTNLLALNAAVEAARAGEAGAGFAVVADEVRSLAMRAAEAAKNTSDLIQVTIQKVNTGQELVTKTNLSFDEVAENASKVDELVAEIAAASKEQAQGIGQVNSAVTEMDKVVQQNASGSEETSSASQEMQNQAEEMKAVLGELTVMINGGGQKPHANKDKGRNSAPQKSFADRLFKSANNIFRKGETADPVQVIPFEDDREKSMPGQWGG